jgi:arylsulfatase A-like enzyme
MAAFCSNISAKVRELGSFHFLFVPLAGLVVYKFLFNVTKASHLTIASPAEKAFALFTLVFLAFAVAAVITSLFAAVGLLRSKWAQTVAQKGSLIAFAGFATVLGLVMADSFMYTMFQFGIKTTDGVVAKLFFLTATGGLFWFFLSVGENYRTSVRSASFRIANIFVVVAAGFAAINLSGGITASASNDRAAAKRYNVVIVSSDGIDATRMSAYGYKRKTTPFIDSIAPEFLIARRAYPNSGHTTGSITSLLTGMLPTRTGVLLPPDSLSGQNVYRSLPRLLRQQGYYANNIAVPHYADASEQNLLGAFDVNNNRNMLSSSFPLTFNYKSTNWFFDQLLGDVVGMVQDVLWIQEMPNPFSLVSGEEQGVQHGFNDASRLRTMISDIANSKKPIFINSHFLGTHGPYFHPKLVKFSTGRDDRTTPWARDLYDDAVLTFDAYAKRVYKALEKSGKLEKTILIIMSDHGIAHDPRRQIPLMIRFPGKAHAGKSIEQNVQVIDVAPTVLDFLGQKKPEWMEGDSLISEELSPGRHVFAGSVEKIMKVAGLGVIGAQKERFGSMDYFYLVHCNSKYRLNLADQTMTVSKASVAGDGCSETQKLNEAEARQVMTKHLDERY